MTMRHTLTRLVILLLLSVSAILPACGGEDDGSNQITTTPANGKSDSVDQADARPISSFILPYDDVVSVELSLIATVVAARRADAAGYSEGENPYQIRYAVYNLRNEAITQALIDAEKNGVDVQILIEADQLDPARDYNTMDDLLVSNGFELQGDHRKLTDEQKKTADLIGVTGSGLMHLKTRLFRYRDASGNSVERLLTGSMNPGDMAVENNETLYLVRDSALIAQYRAKYEAVRDGRRLQNQWSDASAVNVLFTPDDGVQPRDKIIEWIDAEQEAILIAVYAFRDWAEQTGKKSLIDRLIAAHQRGVQVILVTDHKHIDGVDAHGNSIGYDDPVEERLRDAGILVYECTNAATDFTAMHMKMGVFGLSRIKVITDAGNWTKAALGSGSRSAQNTESYLFIDSQRLDENAIGLRHLGAFLQLIETYAPQVHNAQQPTFSALLQQLTALPAWPQITVHFTAQGETAWGETLAITGDHPLLGAWTVANASQTLFTDAQRYPRWDSKDGLSLPFGTRLELKVVKRDASGAIVEWMAGENRKLLVDPHDLRQSRQSRSIGAREMLVDLGTL